MGVKRLLLIAALFGTLIIAGAHPGPAQATTRYCSPGNRACQRNMLLAGCFPLNASMTAWACPDPHPRHFLAVNRTIGVYGAAKEYNGAWCNHDCTVFAEGWYGGGRVWNTSDQACGPFYIGNCAPVTCAGHSFNWGNALAPENGNCFVQPGDSRWHANLWTGTVIKSWVRHACVGGSGFYFSGTASHTLTATENHNIWMGTQTLASPGSGCQI